MAKNIEESRRNIQEATFTNWANACFRIGSKTSKKRVQNLQTDLQDGTVLAELLENISLKSVGPHNKNPTIRAAKVENLGTCFRFLEKEKVKVGNIGKVSIVTMETVFFWFFFFFFWPLCMYNYILVTRSLMSRRAWRRTRRKPKADLVADMDTHSTLPDTK